MIELNSLTLYKCIELLREIRYFETDSPSPLSDFDMQDLETIIEFLYKYWSYWGQKDRERIIIEGRSLG